MTLNINFNWDIWPSREDKPVYPCDSVFQKTACAHLPKDFIHDSEYWASNIYTIVLQQDENLRSSYPHHELLYNTAHYVNQQYYSLLFSTPTVIKMLWLVNCWHSSTFHLCQYNYLRCRLKLHPFLFSLYFGILTHQKHAITQL